MSPAVLSMIGVTQTYARHPPNFAVPFNTVARYCTSTSMSRGQRSRSTNSCEISGQYYNFE
eukprot:7630373-Karenia_brevis.AAC.1